MAEIHSYFWVLGESNRDFLSHWTLKYGAESGSTHREYRIPAGVRFGTLHLPTEYNVNWYNRPHALSPFMHAWFRIGGTSQVVWPCLSLAKYPDDADTT